MATAKSRHQKTATKKRKKSTKTTVATAKPATATEASTRAVSKRRRFRRTPKAERPVYTKVTNVFRLFGSAIIVWKQHLRLFFGLVIVYAVLNIIFVHGISNGADLQSLKSSLDHGLTKSSAKVGNGFTLFVYLLGGSNNASTANPNSGIFQTILLIIMSLSIIWALRQLYAGNPIRVKDTFYRGMYPIIPFLGVVIVIVLQLLPMVFGILLYSVVTVNGIAVGTVEHLLWAALAIFFSLLSLYFLTSSLFALYAVTLPDMTPMKALRSTRELLRYRRFYIMRKILFLPFALVILAGVIMLPILLWLTPAATWTYFVLTILGPFVIHGYMYALYRELLV